MALNYLTGSESPTAALMNELWAEADNVVSKALDGKSLWFLEHKAGTLFSSSMAYQSRLDWPWRGIQFWDYDKTGNSAGGSTYEESVIYGMHVFAGAGSLPSEYDESAVDTAIAASTIGASDTTDEWAQTSSGDDALLSRSLKTHTTTVGVTTCYLWDYNDPAPDKTHKWAVAELMIENHSGTYTLGDSCDKFNFFKIHNLKNQSLTFAFDTNYSVTIAPWEQVCVRRTSVSSGYDSTYKYFFKCQADDPRWLCFDSHGGLAALNRTAHSSVSQSMRANNVCNASYLHALIEGLTQADLIDFDQHDLLNDVTTEYHAAGVIPADPRLATSTRVADLVYTKGKIGIIQRVTSGGTQTAATVDFAGFSTLGTILAPYSITVSTSGNNVNLDTTSDYILLLYGLETNLFTWDDRFRAPEIGTSGSAHLIKTEFLKQPTRLLTSKPRAFDAHSTRSMLAGYVGAAYSDSTTTVADAITAFSLESWITGSNEQAVITTCGPVLKWDESWDYGPTSTAVWSIDEMFHLQINLGGNKLTTENFWPLGLSTDSSNVYRNGWPHPSFITSQQQAGIDAETWAHNGARLIFEGPLQARRYEDGAAHKDFTGDPVAPGGADVTQSDIGTLTDTSIKAQSCDFSMTVPAFSAGDTDKEQMPRCVPNDALLDLETNKIDATWTDSNIAAIRTANSDGDWSGFGADNYLRMNLLKEHYNDLARPIKAARRFAPFNINKIGFPTNAAGTALLNFESTLPLGRQMLLTYTSSVLPIDAWVGWHTGDSYYHQVYTDLFTAFGITIYDADDLADSWSDLTLWPVDGLTSLTTSIRWGFRWVKTADVLAAASAYNFKVQRFETYIPLELERSFTSGTSGLWGFKPVSSGAGYKRAAGVTALCGSTFWNYSTADYDITSQQWMPADRQAGLNGYSAYFVEAIDTSNTGSTKATCISQVVEDSGGAVTDGTVSYSAKTASTFYHTAPLADKKYRVCIKPADNVTHSA